MAKKLKSSEFFSTAAGGFRDFDGFQFSVPRSKLNNEVYTSADHQWGKEKECTGKKM